MESQSSLAMVLCKQSLTIGISTTALIVLVLINSNVHQMMLCLLKNPIDKVTVAPPPSILNCTSKTFHHGIDLRVDVCRGDVDNKVAFFLKKTILRSYTDDDATRLADWLRRCTAPGLFPPTTCLFYPTNNPECPDYSPFNENDFLCHHNNTMHLVINRFRFMKKESKDVIDFILLR